MKNYDNIHHNLTKYEIAEAMEDHYGDENVKCRLGFLMPKIPSGSPKTTNIPKVDSHILNESKPSLGNLTVANYIELYIQHAYVKERSPEHNIWGKKGDQYICVFIGGDISKPVIIGRYEGNMIK